MELLIPALLAGILLVGLMARQSRRGALVPLKFNTQLALGALANDVAVEVTAIAALEQDFDIVSTHLLMGLRENTINEGPIEVGFAASDYTVAEIVEALDASPLRNAGVEMERSRRKVRSYGQFRGGTEDEEINDGLTVKRKMFLRISSGQVTGSVFAVNRSGSTLTTGAIVEVAGVHWGRWK